MQTIDIYRAAKQYIGQFGPDAEMQAAIRYDAMIKAGDTAGIKVWAAILKAISELRGRVGTETEH